MVSLNGLDKDVHRLKIYRKDEVTPPEQPPVLPRIFALKASFVGCSDDFVLRRLSGAWGFPVEEYTKTD